jgi:hypothetical protein
MGTERGRQMGAHLGYIISRRTLEDRPQMHISRKCERAAAGKLRRVGRPSTSREFKPLKRLTVPSAEDYIAALGRTAALARWRVCETLTVYAVNHPAMTCGHVGCAGVGGSGSHWSLRILDGSVRVRAV